MQIIIAFDGDAESYASSDAHLRVERPRSCPNCLKRIRLRALGYYFRWVSSSGRRGTTSIQVRRFRCPVCRLTTSMLPDFAQSYRLVETDTVDRFLSGSRGGHAIATWSGLLENYQRRFEIRLPETLDVLVAVFGFPRLVAGAVEQWERMRVNFGGARVLTGRLAVEAGITVFGVYRCHSPGHRREVHRGKRFASGRGPPSS
jgi:hypothetical protein